MEFTGIQVNNNQLGWVHRNTSKQQDQLTHRLKGEDLMLTQSTSWFPSGVLSHPLCEDENPRDWNEALSKSDCRNTKEAKTLPLRKKKMSLSRLQAEDPRSQNTSFSHAAALWSTAQQCQMWYGPQTAQKRLHPLSFLPSLAFSPECLLATDERSSELRALAAVSPHASRTTRFNWSLVCGARLGSEN